MAFVPVALAIGMAFLYRYMPTLRKVWWVWVPLTLLWVAFLPNTCYLITEWRHFIEYIAYNPDFIHTAAHDSHAMLKFLALSVFYVMYSGVGVLTFSASIWPIDRLFRTPMWGKVVFFGLCALAVYLGLIKRFNSWDILYHPKMVIATSIGTILHPLILLLIIGFAGALWATYWLFEVFVDGLYLRYRRSKQARQGVKTDMPNPFS